MPEANESGVTEKPYDPRELDKIIRQIVDKVRGNYLQNGETGRGIVGRGQKDN